MRFPRDRAENHLSVALLDFDVATVGDSQNLERVLRQSEPPTGVDWARTSER